MHRAELAHKELKDYFAKIDKQMPEEKSGSQTSTNSTAEDGMNLNVGSSLPGTASNLGAILNQSGVMPLFSSEEPSVKPYRKPI